MVSPTRPVATPARFLDEAKALTCVHCGLCLGSCPTYLESGNENDSPRGRIHLMKAVQEGRLPMAGTAMHHLDLCLGCRACESACPSGVPYGALLESTRDYLERTQKRPFFDTLLRRVFIEEILADPERMRLAVAPARWIKAKGLGRFLPRPIRKALDLIPPPDPGRHDPVLPEWVPSATGTRRGRVGLVSGCVMSVLFQRTNQATAQLLAWAGYEVVTPPAQVCCGALFSHGGNLERARACARKNIAAFEPLELDAIIINAAGCGSTLKEYGHLLEDDARWAEPARRFGAQVKDLTEWLTQPGLPLPAAAPAAADSAPVTYHDACHLAHPQGIKDAPRRLVQAVAGSRYVELPESDVCCGSAGSYNLTEPAMAERLQSRKIQNILSTGARTVVTTNPGCLLQIQAGLERAGAAHVRAVHIADYLVESLGGSGAWLKPTSVSH